jgi:hypothetical protein
MSKKEQRKLADLIIKESSTVRLYIPSRFGLAFPFARDCKSYHLRIYIKTPLSDRM